MPNGYESVTGIGFASLICELKVAITFAESARRAGADARRRERNLANARFTLETINRYRSGVQLEEHERIRVDRAVEKITEILYVAESFREK